MILTWTAVVVKSFTVTHHDTGSAGTRCSGRGNNRSAVPTSPEHSGPRTGKWRAIDTSGYLDTTLLDRFDVDLEI